MVACFDEAELTLIRMFSSLLSKASPMPCGVRLSSYTRAGLSALANAVVPFARRRDGSPLLDAETLALC